jgi:hypothetical protein
MVKLFIWTFSLLLVVLIPVHVIGGDSVSKSVVLAYALSVFNILFGHASIRWSFKRSNKTFYSVIIGGMAGRFILFILAFYYILRHSHLSLVGFLISFFCLYLFLQYFEIRMVNRHLKKVKE